MTGASGATHGLRIYVECVPGSQEFLPRDKSASLSSWEMEISSSNVRDTSEKRGAQRKVKAFQEAMTNALYGLAFFVIH